MYIQVDAPSMKAFEQKLGLKYPVIYYFNPDSQVLDPSSRYDPRGPKHEVFIPENIFLYPIKNNVRPENALKLVFQQSPSRMAEVLDLGELLERLCQLWLGETIHPAFDSACFCDASQQPLELHDPRIQEVGQAWLLCTNVWVSDLRYQHWPKAFAHDVVFFSDYIGTLWTSPRPADRATFYAKNGQRAVISFLTQARRYNIPLGNRGFFTTIQQTLKLNPVVNFLTNMPRLNINPQQDLILLEQSVQRVMQLSKGTFVPHLVPDPDEPAVLLWQVK